MSTGALPPRHPALVPMTSILAAQIRVEMTRVWGLLQIGSNDPISLRAIPSAFLHAPVKDCTFTPREYPNVAARQRAFENGAIALNMQGYNCYIIMNRVREGFRGSKAVADRDILLRTLLLIDIDRAWRADSPASPPELYDCMLVAKAVREFLAGSGFPACCGAFSGNGFHLYYRLDGLPNHRFTRDQIKALLKGLAARFDTDKARVDTVVHNASRITKLPGTIAYKGTASPGRDYRMARLIDAPPLSAATADDLQRVLDVLCTITNAGAMRAHGSPLQGEPDTPLRRARLSDALRFMSADSERDDWRDTVWAILSTGWRDAPIIAEAWCRTAPHRFTQHGFDNLLGSYDPGHSECPTLGTIFYRAREAGWNG
ncbi:MAG: hypothetical protein C0494_08175 [Sphingobium sp.]|nr:hypothetical protein [Sphingobium sp.]